MAQDLSTTTRRWPLLLAAGAALALVVTLLVELRSSGPAAGGGTALDAAATARGNAAAGAGAADGAEPTSDITLAFAGEVHLEGVLQGLPDQGGSTLGPMTRALERADIAMVNLESAITDGSDAPASKELEDPGNRYWFDTSPSVLGLMERSGVDVVSMANNHGADYGRGGLRTALAAEEESEVGIVGIGRSPEEAYAPERFEVDGASVAVLAADASPRESADRTWAIGRGTGVGMAAARRPDAPALVRAVEAADETDDVVVVYLHWGAEGQATPTDAQRRLAENLAEAGADVVVGAHAHVLLGSGMLEDTYVSYGLGNFAWYHGRQAETGVLRLRIRTQDGDARVVGEQFWPGRIPLYGGVPEALPKAERPAAVRAWRSLREGTGLQPVPAAQGGGRDRDDAAPEASEEQPEEQSDGQGTDLPAYVGEVRRLDAATRARMLGVSHRPAECPVGWGDLRLLSVSYVDFDGDPQVGELVVHRDVARDAVGIFRDLYRERFPIKKMRLVDDYDGDDDRSMAANNTSAYNCRFVAGSTTLSNHAYGRAIDINPVQNPYVLPDGVLPPSGSRFASVDRSPGARAAQGVIVGDDVVVRVFTSRGWRWGASFSDYQHFDKG